MRSLAFAQFTSLSLIGNLQSVAVRSRKSQKAYLWLVALLGPLLLAGCGRQNSDGQEVKFLSSLSAKADQGFYADRDANGQVNYVGGSDLVPSCIAGKGNAASDERLAHCILNYFQPIFPFPVSRLMSPDVLRISRRPALGGLQTIVLRAMYRDVPVIGSQIALTFDRNGQLVELTGRLLDPESYSTVEAVSRYASAADAHKFTQKKIGAPLFSDGRAYDPGHRRIVSLYGAVDRERMRYWFDERLGVVIAVRDIVQNDDLIKHIEKRDYTNDTGYYINLGAGASLAPATLPSLTLSDGTCKLTFNHGSDAENAEAKLSFTKDGPSIYGIGNCEPEAPLSALPPNDDITSVYFWMHDLAEFARAEYKSRYNWHNYQSENLRVVIDRNGTECSDGAGGCSFYGRTEHRIHLPRSKNAPWELRTMAHEHGHFMHYMYDVKSYDISSLGDTGRLSGAMLEGIAEHNWLRYTLHRFVHNASRPFDEMGALNYQSAQWNSHDAGTISHGQYDANFLIHRASQCTDEHACGNVIADVYWELVWNACRSPFTGPDNNVLCDAVETIIKGVPQSITPIRGDVSVATEGRSESEVAPVSASLPMLLHPTTAPTLGTAPPSDLAHQAANIAFTYALIAAESTSTVHSFFRSVSKAYDLIRKDGHISYNDFQRVLAVLNHHCVGWGRDCEMRRVLPNHELPVMRSKRSRLNDCVPNACAELVLAQEADRSVETAMTPHDETMQFAQLDEPGDWLRFAMEIPRADFYRIGGSVRGNGPVNLTITYPDSPDAHEAIAHGEATADLATWRLVDAGMGEWAWRDGPTLPLPAGEQTINVAYDSGAIDIEALTISYVGDPDSDGVPSNADNCPDISNPQQEDINGNGRGDICECDADGDKAEYVLTRRGMWLCMPGRDNCPLDVNPKDPATDSQPDLDGDGIGDACDDDVNGDGIPESVGRVEIRH